MGSHPNVVLMAVLTPNKTSQKTLREILGTSEVNSVGEVKIASQDYFPLVMESDYDEGYQIQAKEGDLVFFNHVTYGYGETVGWEKLEAQKKELEAWAAKVSTAHDCSFEVIVTANYW